MGRLSSRPVVHGTYECLGRLVHVPPTADIEPGFEPGGTYSELVQTVLDGIDTPWVGGYYRTAAVDGELPLRVVVSRGKRIVWAKHKAHKAHYVGLSPFMYVGSEGRQTNRITVQVEMKGDTPWLVRAYAGEQRPPLPWMKSAHFWYQGGVEGCKRFWREHAFVHNPAIIVPRSERDHPVASPPRPRRSGSRKRR